jgi:hypothetical protein
MSIVQASVKYKSEVFVSLDWRKQDGLEHQLNSLTLPL